MFLISEVVSFLLTCIIMLNGKCPSRPSGSRSCVLFGKVIFFKVDALIGYRKLSFSSLCLFFFAMITPSVSLVLLVVVLWYFTKCRGSNRRRLPLPPGPKGVPFLGNLLQVCFPSSSVCAIVFFLMYSFYRSRETTTG